MKAAYYLSDSKSSNYVISMQAHKIDKVSKLGRRRGLAKSTSITSRRAAPSGASSLRLTASWRLPMATSSCQEEMFASIKCAPWRGQYQAMTLDEPRRQCRVPDAYHAHQQQLRGKPVTADDPLRRGSGVEVDYAFAISITAMHTLPCPRAITVYRGWL